ncbi:MAG TPA: hypothetical protein ENJ95_21520 [Bacteroidetes bacterium]|nr:hypothetical protein [Bacteroidota bacterium]
MKNQKCKIQTAYNEAFGVYLPADGGVCGGGGNVECRMQNAECRMQNEKCRMQNAELRPAQKFESQNFR